MKGIIFLFFAVQVLINAASAQKSHSLDEKLKGRLHREYFTINVLIQSEGRYSFRDDDFQGGRTFRVSNARLSLRGNLDGGFFYRLYFDAAPQPALLDAYIGYKISDIISLSVGSMKPDQTLDYIPDPGSHMFVDRAAITSLLVASREIGISATGNIDGFYYYAGLFNGNRQNSNNNNKFYGIGRLQYLFNDLIAPAHIQIGISGSHGNSAGTRSGSNGPFLRGKRTIAGSDIEARWERLYFAAEYLTGALQTIDLPNDDETIKGYYFTGGLQLSDKVMTLGRWQSWSYKVAGIKERKMTLGCNIDFSNIAGLLLNLDAYFSDQGTSDYGASFIFQVQF